MRLIDMNIGQTVSRSIAYSITRVDNDRWVFNSGRLAQRNSIMWTYTDFKLKENNMKTNVNYIGGEYNVVEVTYDLGAVPTLDTYYFKVDKDLELKEDDLVVVEAKRGLGITKVVEVFENNINNADKVKEATAWVVDKVDYSRQLERKEATEKREYILQQLEEKKEQMETIKMYALLAEMDPEAKKLVDELKTLGK